MRNFLAHCTVDLRIMQFYATKGKNMSFIEQLLFLFKKTPATPAEVPPEALEYNGFLVAETADLMQHLERREPLYAIATDGIKTAHVFVRLNRDFLKRQSSFYAHYAYVMVRIENGMHQLPYACYVDISTFRNWDTPLEYTKTYFGLHCSMVDAVRKSEIMPNDEKALIMRALHELEKGQRDKRYNY